MNMEIMVHIGFLYFVLKLNLFTLPFLDLNMFLKKLKDLLSKKNIKTNIIRMHSNNTTMCGYFCIGFTDFIFAGKTLIDHTSLFSSDDFKKMMV